MRKVLLSVSLLLFSLLLFACATNSKDEITFNDNTLNELVIGKGSNIDLLDGVSAKSSLNSEITISIVAFNNFNINNIGTYTITYLATSQAGGKATQDRVIKVVDVSDEGGPIFENIKNGYLPSIDIILGDEINLLDGVYAADIDGILVNVNVVDNNIDFNKAGNYTVTYEAIDKEGRRSIALRNIRVLQPDQIEIEALFINGNHSPYLFNNENALKHTSSGTQFRSFDQIQVMTKEFFINSYNENKDSHTNNGNVPFFSSGVIVVLDNNMKVKHVRVASPLVEVDELGNIKTYDLDWSNTLDKTNGGGNFSNIITKMDEVIPNGGYIIFAPPKDDNLSKTFLVKNILDSSYTGENIDASKFDVDFNSLEIKLDIYKEEIIDDEYVNEPINEIIVKDKYLDGIPVTTYYYNDGQTKPVIFFFHGFAGSRKGSISTRGTDLAKLGFYVISLDAYLHGERMPDYFNNLSYGDKQKDIVNIQIQTAKDAKHIFNKYYARNKYVKHDEVYTFGVSMGAGSAIYLASIMDEVNGVISMLGSPSFIEFYKYKQKEYNWDMDITYFNNLNSYIEHDPFLNYELYKDVNIYFAGGSKDTVVPAIYAENFKALYEDNDNIVFKLYNTGHTSTTQMHTDIYEFLEKIKN